MINLPAGKKIPPHLQSSYLFFLIAFGLINILAFTLLLCSISFLTGHVISIWQFPLACLCSLVVNYAAASFFFEKNRNNSFLKSTGIIAGLIVVLIFFAKIFYDFSFDGQWYHQETIFDLHSKWDPVSERQSAPSTEDKGAVEGGLCPGMDIKAMNTGNAGRQPVNLKLLNINHFAKGIEITEAAIYQLTNRIETGKAVNGIFLFASFFLILSFFYKIVSIGKRKKWMLAILISFNPITITQLLTFCVDGVLASSILCLIGICCMLYVKINKFYLLFLASTIILTVNIKYTSLAFTVIFCLGLLIALVIDKKWRAVKPVLYTSVFAGLTGLFCVGFNPYLTNVLNDHNIFFGLGETKNEIAVLTPPLFKNMNRFEKLFLSLSAHSEEYAADTNSIACIPKIPFTLTKKELQNAYDPELKIAALGPFFSGALLLSLFIFVIASFRFRKNHIFRQVFILLTAIAATILIVPDSWWLRFIPQLWLFVLSILFMSEFFPLTTAARFLRGFTYISLGLCIGWAMLSFKDNLFVARSIDYQMSQLKTLNQPVRIQYCLYNYKSLTSNRVRFFEAHIPIINETQPDGNYTYIIPGSNTRVETAHALPALPRPSLSQWLIQKIER